MHIYNISVTYLQSIKKIHLKLSEELISQSMHYQYYGKHLAVKIKKWHNSCNTDPSAPIFLSNMHCLIVKVWCKFDQNWLNTFKVTEERP